MRIVSWNCNLSLSRKVESLLRLEPDLAVLQECEEDLRVPDGYEYVWRGNNPRKGLGVLSRAHAISVEPSARSEWAYFLPITVPTHQLRILATWAYNHRARRFGGQYIGNPLLVMGELSAWLREGRSIVAGDFNNSVVWDSSGSTVKFADIDAFLKGLGLTSAYHSLTGEALGSEKMKTFFHTKKDDRAYHIDYCFVHESLAVERVRIPAFEEWRSQSDHVPVIVDIANDG
jgi:endonuclease/exonuclease/phosphatase family metal-dependent hydrolase